MPIVRSEEHRAVVDEPLQRGDALVGGVTIAERMGEVARELLAHALDGQGDALGDEREEVARSVRGLRRSVVAEYRLL